MPADSYHPPQHVPGLDEFLTAPGALHDVTITAPYGGMLLNISATTTDPVTGEEIPLAIQSEDSARPSDYWPRTLFAVVGDSQAPFNEGKVEPTDLGLDRNTREGAILWAAFVELREAYRHLLQIRDGYFPIFREHAIERLDFTVSSRSRLTPTQEAIMRGW